MQIDQGGTHLRVAQQPLQSRQIDPGLQQVGGIAMSQGVGRDVLVQPGPLPRLGAMPLQ